MNAEPLIEHNNYAELGDGDTPLPGAGPRSDVESGITPMVKLAAAHRDAMKLFRRHWVIGTLLLILSNMPVPVLGTFFTATFYLILFATGHKIVSRTSQIDGKMINAWISLHGLNVFVYALFLYVVGTIMAVGQVLVVCTMVFFVPLAVLLVVIFVPLLCVYSLVSIFQLPSILFLQLNPFSAMLHSWRTVQAIGICRSCGMCFVVMLPVILSMINTFVFVIHTMAITMVATFSIAFFKGLMESDLGAGQILRTLNDYHANEMFAMLGLGGYVVVNAVFLVLAIVILVVSYFFNVYAMCLIYSIFCQAHEYMGQPLLNSCVDVGVVSSPADVGAPVPIGSSKGTVPTPVTTEKSVTARDLEYSNVGSYGPVNSATTSTVQRSSLEVEQPDGSGTGL